MLSTTLPTKVRCSGLQTKQGVEPGLHVVSCPVADALLEVTLLKASARHSSYSTTTVLGNGQYKRSKKVPHDRGIFKKYFAVFRGRRDDKC
jgi:hypothetical protein